MNNLIDIAKIYAHARLSVIPTLADKRPACPWKVFTQRVMNDAEIERLFGDANGIGIVCGKVSGNLELLDFDDGGSAFEPWFVRVPPYLKARLVVEQSPSGGKHVYYRVGSPSSESKSKSGMIHSSTSTSNFDYPVPGNRKLAMKADGKVLIETRGEGGYVKCAPSEGYVLVQGDFEHVPTVSAFEQNYLIELAQGLDEKIDSRVEVERGRDVVSHGERGERGEDEGLGHSPSSTPLHLYTADNSTRSLCSTRLNYTPTSPLDIAQMEGALVGAGWKKVRDGKEQHWERPGKNERATSATFNGEVFYVFSSNAAPFEPNRGYSPRHVIKVLNGGFVREGVGVGDGCTKEVANSTVDLHLKPTPSPSTFTSPSSFILPPSSFHVPGFISELMEHTLAGAPYPNVPLAFAGALTMLSHLSGRNFRTLSGLRTNIYVCALASSGSGKDYPRKVNLNLAARLGITPTMADRFASAEGLEDSLLVKPASFYMPDEIDTVFAALRDKDSAMERIYASLLQFYTSADTVYTMRKKALQTAKLTKFDRLRAIGIVAPHLTLFGTAIPRYFFEALSERSLQNGLLSRCLVLDAGTRGSAGPCEAGELPTSVVSMGEALVARGGFDGVDFDNLDYVAPAPNPQIVDETEDATRRLREVREECDRLYGAAQDETERALWTRGAEKTMKLAMLYAISGDVEVPTISCEAVDWAWTLVERLTRYTLDAAALYVHDNAFDEMRQRVIRYLSEAGGRLQHGALLKRMHTDVDTFRKVIETLVESEIVTLVQRTPTRIDYQLV